MSKTYGLHVPKKSGPSLTKHTAFNQSDSEDSEQGGSTDWVKKSLQKGTSQQNVKKQTRIDIQRALEQDSTVYQYDEVYDQMEAKRSEASTTRLKERKPKYIQQLMQTADKRKRENERRVERQVQKEREDEGEIFKDKETFVTSAYRKKLEEFAQAEEEERRQNRLEEIGDVTKQQDISGIYRHLYQTTIEPTEEEKKSKTAKVDEKSSKDLERSNKESRDSVKSSKSGNKESEPISKGNRETDKSRGSRESDKSTRGSHESEKSNKEGKDSIKVTIDSQEADRSTRKSKDPEKPKSSRESEKTRESREPEKTTKDLEKSECEGSEKIGRESHIENREAETVKRQERQYRKRHHSISSGDEKNADADTSLESSSDSQEEKSKQKERDRRSKDRISSKDSQDKPKRRVSLIKDKGNDEKRGKEYAKMKEESKGKEVNKQKEERSREKSDRAREELKSKNVDSSNESKLKAEMKKKTKSVPSYGQPSNHSSIWKKRTVGPKFDEALMRFIQRQAERRASKARTT